jgi:hypothetical protein
VRALAHVALGRDDRADELERESELLAGEGYEFAFVGPRCDWRFPGDRAELQRLVELVPHRTRVFGASTVAARLDAFVALGDTANVELLASSLLEPGTYVEPFTLRALGLVRGDDERLARAQERFAALGLDWHAAQTDALARR